MSTRDPFLSESFAIERLLSEYQEHGRLIIAFDFDDTVYDYHRHGRTYDKVLELLRTCQRRDFILTLFTDMYGDKRDIALRYLEKVGITPDYINETPDFIPFGHAGKPYYNILLDDRAGLASAYRILTSVLAEIDAKAVTDEA